MPTSYCGQAAQQQQCSAMSACRLPSVPAMDTILNLDNVMIYPEFVEGLARCSMVGTCVVIKHAVSLVPCVVQTFIRYLLGSQAYLTNTLWCSVKVAEQFLCCSEHHCDVAASEHFTMSHLHEMSTPQHVTSELYVMGCKVFACLMAKHMPKGKSCCPFVLHQ